MTKDTHEKVIDRVSKISKDEIQISKNSREKEK